MSRVQLLSVNVGLAREVAVGGRKVRTAIFKQPVSSQVAVTRDGLVARCAGQHPAVRGLAKALCAYSQEHCAFWQAVRAQARVALWAMPLLKSRKYRQQKDAGRMSGRGQNVRQ